MDFWVKSEIGNRKSHALVWNRVRISWNTLHAPHYKCSRSSSPPTRFGDWRYCAHAFLVFIDMLLYHLPGGTRTTSNRTSTSAISRVPWLHQRLGNRPLPSLPGRNDIGREVACLLSLPHCITWCVTCSATCTPLNRLRSTPKQRKLTTSLQVNTGKLAFCACWLTLTVLSKFEVGCQGNGPTLLFTWTGCLM